MKQSTYVKFLGTWLGEHEFNEQLFSKKAYEEISSLEFLKLSAFQKHRKIAAILVREIDEYESPCFLLPHILSFIREVRKNAYPTFTFDSFEFQLIHFEGLSEKRLYEICGKIMGRYIPRSEYQSFFPIGANKKYKGPNISVSHLSADVDTCVASHICFMDAFAARVGTSCHYWRVPGGAPKENADIDFIFHRPYGEDIFSILSKTENEIEVSCLDLVTQTNVIFKKRTDLSYGGDHERSQKAILVVNEEGQYLADWRYMDVDSVRSICSWLMSMLRDYETEFHIGLIELFSKKKLTRDLLRKFIQKMFNRRLNDCKIAKEFTDLQRINLHRFFLLVLDISNGYSSTILEFFDSRKGTTEFSILKQKILDLSEGPLFDEKDNVVEDRSQIFQALEKIFSYQTMIFQKFFNYLDTLDVALQVKKDVLGFLPSPISHMSNVEAVIEEFKNYGHLTVTYEENDKHYILGVIHVDTLKERFLGTVNIRDFSNPHEMIKPKYLEIISVIDHHKSELITEKPSLIRIQDAQSTNVVSAEISMKINDRYSTLGMSIESIEGQITEVSKNLDLASNRRILERLLKRKSAFLSKRAFFVSPEREFLELFQCLVAILDDTDFLTKVTAYDVDATRDILNRLVSLKSKQELEVVNFDDLFPDAEDYVTLAARKLLQSQHLYSVYSKSGRAKEQKVDELIKKATRDEASVAVLFQDCKVLSKYAQITQFKHFMSNFPLVEKKKADLQTIWHHRATVSHKEHQSVNLYIFMLTSIASAEELYSDFPDRTDYKDELWIWIPEKDKKAEFHLHQFLSQFHASPKMKNQKLEIVLHGKHPERYEEILSNSFKRSFSVTKHRSGPPILILKVDPKSLNSRKAEIAPYL